MHLTCGLEYQNRKCVCVCMCRCVCKHLQPSPCVWLHTNNPVAYLNPTQYLKPSTGLTFFLNFVYDLIMFIQDIFCNNLEVLVWKHFYEMCKLVCVRIGRPLCFCCFVCKNRYCAHARSSGHDLLRASPQRCHENRLFNVQIQRETTTCKCK